MVAVVVRHGPFDWTFLTLRRPGPACASPTSARGSGARAEVWPGPLLPAGWLAEGPGHYSRSRGLVVAGQKVVDG